MNDSLMTYSVNAMTAGHFRTGRIAFLTLVLCFATIAPSDAQISKEASSDSLLVTLSEFEIGGHLPILSRSNCINVWANGRFHLERRLQGLGRTSADLLVYDSTLPSAQLRALKDILESDGLKRLPEPSAPPSSAAKTWVRGTRARITRDAAVQEVGYLEWGTHETADDSHPAREVVNSPQPDAARALKPLEDWLLRVQSEHLSSGSFKPTMCDLASPEI